MKKLLARVDRWQQRRPSTAFPVAVYTRFNEHNGARLAANISYYAFFSIFPLMLVFVTILGLVLDDRPDLQDDLTESALANVPLIGSQLEGTDPLSGNVVALVIGIVVGILGGLRMIDALGYGLNELWDVPAGSRLNAVSARVRGVLVLAVFGGGLVASTTLASLPAAVDLGAAGPIVGLLASGLANVVVIIAAQKLLIARPLTLGELWPGSLIAGVLVLVLQQLAVALAQQLGGSSDTYGVFAGIIGLLAFFHLLFRVMLLSLELNVVRALQLYPRSINPGGHDITDGDRRALLLDVQRVQRDKRVGYAVAVDDLVDTDDGSIERVEPGAGRR